jgi:uncharacterized protein YndB with AHSA1/START domain
MATGTVRLHRVIRAPAERIQRAFLDADTLPKWMPPHGFVGKVHSMDAKVGGEFKMSFTNLTTGKNQPFAGVYKTIVPGKEISYAEKFDDPHLKGEMTTTVTMRPVSVGTEVTIVQEGIPEPIPVEMCYLGWQESLQLLTLLVEPEIKD